MVRVKITNTPRVEVVNDNALQIDYFTWRDTQDLDDMGFFKIKPARPTETEADLIAAAAGQGDGWQRPFFTDFEMHPLREKECSFCVCSARDFFTSSWHRTAQDWLRDYDVEWDPDLRF